MSGSGVIDFLINLIVLFGTGALFFIGINRAAPDPLMNKIGKIAVGVVLAVVVLMAIKAVLFGGGAAMAASGSAIIGFAIGIIVLFLVLFLLDKVLEAGASWGFPVWLIDIIRYVVFALVLIALLVLCDKTFFGGQYTGKYLNLGESSSIMKPERR